MILEATIPTFNAAEGNAHDFNKWLFETIQPYVIGKTLEMKSGHGVMAAIFEENHMKIHLSEPNQALRHELRKKFQEKEAIRYVHNIDFTIPDFDDTYRDHAGAFDTLIAVNLADQRPYDKIELLNAKKLLSRRGKLIVAIPSFTALYQEIDLSLQQWKKFNRKPIRRFLSGFTVKKTILFQYVADHSRLADQSGFHTIVIARKD